ncbi:MAG: tRNA lysidine(34) synthetase TilS, partial [Lachnospiraceae bacterium]|nr:tRNA lysidine(34) synthetase TilS [Lachnospiraceae bacterium]
LDKGIPEKGMLKEDLGPMSPVEKDDVQGETDLYRLPFIEAGNFEKRLDFGAYKIEIQILTQNEEFNYRDNMVTKIFDYDKINNTLVFRRRQIGDYMVINKEGNKAKLKKIFIEKKIDESQRDKILLLALDDTSQVLLADGVRRCFGYHVDKESKRILLIRKIDS